ncbi:MAG: metalloprotease PmbA [Gammaproteobacteria bacterium]
MRQNQHKNFFYAEKMQAVAERALELAKKQGATEAEVAISAGQGFTVRVRRHEVETIEHQQGRELAVTVFLGKKKATANTNDLSDTAIKLTVDHAYQNASYASEDPYHGLAGPNMLAYDYPDLDLYHPWNISVKDGVKLAREYEDLAFTLDPRITNSEGTTIAVAEGFHLYGNSLGFIGSYPLTSYTVSCSLIAGHGDSMQRDGDYTVSCEPNNLLGPSVLVKSAVDRTVRRLGASGMPTCNCSVLFSAEVAQGLFGAFLSAINGYKLYRRATFLVDYLDKQVFSERVFVEERPHEIRRLSSVPFDSEGVKKQRRVLVDSGILRGYVLDSYTGRRLNMPTTGNAGGVSNVFVRTSDNDLNNMLKMMGKGLYVTELLGSGANIVTGDYSRAAFGFWVENGEIQRPVSNITIAANLHDMLKGIVAIGNDIDWRGNIYTGSVLLENMVIAGQ